MIERFTIITLVLSYIKRRTLEFMRPKSATSLDVFRDSASAAGALPAIWAKPPQSLVLRGEDKGLR